MTARPVESPVEHDIELDRAPVPVDTDTGDHERYAHYVYGANPRAAITQAIVTGRPVRALCGKLWIPSRDPARFPICPECTEIKRRALSQ